MQPPSRAGRLRAGVALALLLGSLLVGLDTVAWLRLERLLDRRVVAFGAGARAAGWRFSARAGERGGWPLAATLTLIRPSLQGTGPLLPGEIGWSGDRVTLSLSPLHPRHAILFARGTQSLSLANASPMTVRIRMWGARIAVEPGPDGTDRRQGSLLVEADALHLATPGAGPDDIAQVAGATARVGWRLPPDGTAGGPGSLSLSLQLRDVALPVRFGHGGGRVVQHARLEAVLTGPISLRLQPIDRILALWAGGGGRLRIDEASVGWGDSSAALAGTARLAADGTADGRFDLALTQPGQALQQSETAGLVGRGAATAIGAVIGLVGAARPATGDPPLHLPLQLRQGVLGLGEIPLLRIGPEPGRGP